jgi:hypothetical protein
VGCVESDASSRRNRQGALRRVESHGYRHALSRRRHGGSVHADQIHAGIGCAQATSGGERDRMPLYRREAFARPRSIPSRDPCSVEMLMGMRTWMGCNS